MQQHAIGYKKQNKKIPAAKPVVNITIMTLVIIVIPRELATGLKIPPPPSITTPRPYTPCGKVGDPSAESSSM